MHTTLTSVRRSPVPRLAIVLGFLLLLPVATAQDAAAQDMGSIAGALDAHSEGGASLATASLPALALSAPVAEDGSFAFDAVPPGEYLLLVKLPSVGVVTEMVTVLAGQEATVELEFDHFAHSEEIVVIATGDLRERSDLSNPVSVLEGAELQLRMGATLGETLAGEPGVASSAFVAGSARPIIRGLTGARVRVLTDGLDTGDASDTSADHAVASDPVDAERIEVLRGPATLRYGSSAIGGAVNIVDERIPTNRAAQAVSGSVDLVGGSVADERLGALELGGGSGEWAWTLGAVSRETDPYDIPGFAHLEEEEEEDEGEEEEEDVFGMVPNSDLSTESGRFGVTRFFGDRGFLGVAVSGFDTNYGIPPGAHAEEEEEEGEDEDHGEEEEGPIRIDLKQRRVDLRSDVFLSSGAFDKFEFKVAGTDYEHVEFEGDEVGTRFENDFFETRMELFQRERETSRGSFGLQYTDRDLVAAGEEAYVPPTVSNAWALFTSQEIERGPVRWQFGARFEQAEHDPVNMASWSDDGVSASAGLVWSTNDMWTLGLSASRSVRLPSATELFADGFHAATQTYEVGNPNLDRETGNGVDLSLHKKEGKVQGEVTLFRQNFQDFIYQAFTGMQREGAAVIRYRQADATMTGAEFRARIEVMDWNDHHMHVEVLGDTVDAELDSGGNLPRIPPMSFGAGLHYHGHNWRSAVEWRWVDDQRDVYEQSFDQVTTDIGTITGTVRETPTEGYTMLNAHVGRRFVLRNQILDVLLRGRNLTDEEARAHTSFLKTFAPLPGRDVSLSAKLWF